MEERLRKVEDELSVIRERNRRVEANKAWETSVFRMFSLAFVTYLVAIVLLYLIKAENYLLGALVPAAGFILSVQSLPALKRWWMRRFLNRRE